MGHFITLQNILLLIGGPLNLEREDFPYRTEFYPFPFRLEPFTRRSLANTFWRKSLTIQIISAAGAVKEHFDGKFGALIGYEKSVAKRFDGYLKQKSAYYSIEKRWPDSECWKTRTFALEYERD